MIKKKYSHVIIYFVIILLLAVYESAEMTRITLVKLHMDTDVIPFRYRIALFLICLLFCLKHAKPRTYLFKPLAIFTIYILIVSTIHGIYSTSLFSNIVDAISILLPLLFFFTFFYMEKCLDVRFFYIGLIIACVWMLISFLDTYKIQVLFSLSDDTRTNSFYIYLFLLPLFLLLKNDNVKVVSIVSVLVAMLFSLKRGGMISFVLALSVYYLVNNYCLRRKNGLKSLIILFIGVAIMFVIFQLMENYADSMILRLNSIESDEGSDRIGVYNTTWKMITESNFLSLCFGHGWNMVLKDSPMEMSAHNDFLEVLYDFGIIAEFLYVWIYVKLFNRLISMIRRRSEYAAPFAFSIITFAFNSMIAHVVIYPFNFIIVMLVWGYISSKDDMLLKCNKIMRNL